MFSFFLFCFIKSLITLYLKVINTVEEAEQERSLLKIVHDELAQFFDIADEKEFREIQDKYPNSR